MFQPEELKKNEPLLWSVGTGTQVWELFSACAAGYLETVERLVGMNPSLMKAITESELAQLLSSVSPERSLMKGGGLCTKVCFPKRCSNYSAEWHRLKYDLTAIRSGIGTATNLRSPKEKLNP